MTGKFPSNPRPTASRQLAATGWSSCIQISGGKLRTANIDTGAEFRFASRSFRNLGESEHGAG
jgi:hypothetical protein